MVGQFLTHKNVLDKLNTELLPRMGSRTSGYTSVVRMGPRMGDGAMIVKMSLILDAAKAPVKKAKVEEKSASRPSDGGKPETEIIEAEVVEDKKPAKAKTKKETTRVSGGDK